MRENRFIHKLPMEFSVRADVRNVAGCSKRLSGKAAASEDRRRTLWGTLRI
jgi:hypothetical protein